MKTDMTDNEIRIAVAEACGWKNCRCNTGGNIPFGEPDDDFNRDEFPVATEHGPEWITLKHREELPDYLNDLNATAEMEKHLNNQFVNEIEAYHRELRHHVKPHPISATARQRCEAFLRVKGLWKD